MEYKLKFAEYLVDGIETDSEYSEIFGYRLLFPKKLFTLSNNKQKYIDTKLSDNKSIKSISPSITKDIDSCMQYLHSPTERGITSSTAMNLVTNMMTYNKSRESITYTVKDPNHLSTAFGFDVGSQQSQRRDSEPIAISLTAPSLKKTVTLGDILNGTASVPSQSVSKSLNYTHSAPSHRLSQSENGHQLGMFLHIFH